MRKVLCYSYFPKPPGEFFFLSKATSDTFPLSGGKARTVLRLLSLTSRSHGSLAACAADPAAVRAGRTAARRTRRKAEERMRKAAADPAASLLVGLCWHAIDRVGYPA